jgi:hypothetical protein
MCMGMESTSNNNPTYVWGSRVAPPFNLKKQKIMEIQGQDVLKIKKTNIVRNYKEGAAEGFAGKQYRIYASGENAFAVHEDDDFHQDLKDGDVKLIDITVTDDGWSLNNYVTWTKANAFKEKEAKFESITAENFKPQRMVNPKEYAGL